MALQPCRECKAEISSRAKVCPHCGLKRPHDLAIQHWLNDAAGGMFRLGCGLILLAIIAIVLFGLAAAGVASAEDQDASRTSATVLSAYDGDAITVE